MEKTKRYNVRLSLEGGGNDTYSATFVLELPGKTDTFNSSISAEEDARLASYYVASVFLIYGLSIVLLIASSIRRKRHKQLQDQQINKYLREFQVVQETSSKSHYRNLKHAIAAKLEALPRTQPGSTGLTQSRLSHIVPLVIGLPLAQWPEGSQGILNAPQDQLQVESAAKRHTSVSENSEPDYFRESSYDADVSTPTSPLNPPSYGVGEQSVAASCSTQRFSLVGDNTCSRCPMPEIVVDDTGNDDILPDDNGIPLLTTNTGLDVEVDINEQSTLLDPNGKEAPRSENEDGRVDGTPGECYYVGDLEHSPFRSKDNATQVGRLIIDAMEQLTTTESTIAPREDDPVGAMRYAVAVVLIYSLAMVFLIGAHVRSQSNSRQRDGDTARYLKLVPSLRATNDKACRLKEKMKVVEKLETVNGKDLEGPHRTIVVSLVYVRTKMQQRENLDRALQREVARITHQFPPNKTITVEVVQLPAAANTSGRAILGDTHGGGALLYILVFLFVYGVVAAFLVVFNVAKSRRKLMQDQQINEYLKVMRVVQRTSSRSHRRHRKMAIVAKLNASPHLQQSAAMPRPMSSSRGQWPEHPAPDRGDAEERRLLSMERKTDDIQLETIPSSTCVSGLEETSADIEEHGNECDDSYDFDFTLLQTPALRTSNV
ncbi:hypothetical protein NP493_548g02026 [Ridgeia piscesae]|uniref:Uncharacterized protein n=1 Tax=Ridgeia piscesae TaxID=27915 RepID=A0AAD9NQ61_RIDPI|nr:hypothetical protein NP493_548g02026 [Ridgeia piscesae]